MLQIKTGKNRYTACFYACMGPCRRGKGRAFILGKCRQQTLGLGSGGVICG